MDLFEFIGRVDLLMIDCYSRWFEFEKVIDTAWQQSIKNMKNVLARPEVSTVIRSDNGP